MERECIRIQKKNEFNFANNIYVRFLFRTYKNANFFYFNFNLITIF